RARQGRKNGEVRLPRRAKASRRRRPYRARTVVLRVQPSRDRSLQLTRQLIRHHHLLEAGKRVPHQAHRLAETGEPLDTGKFLGAKPKVEIVCKVTLGNSLFDSQFWGFDRSDRPEL